MPKLRWNYEYGRRENRNMANGVGNKEWEEKQQEKKNSVFTEG